MMSTCMNSSSSWLCGVGAGGGAMGALKNGKKGMARFPSCRVLDFFPLVRGMLGFLLV
jgi:hypothetical protein